MLLAVQYKTSPLGNGASITVKKSGKKAKIFACIASVGAGFSFCCIHIETPIATGQAPITKNEGTSYGNKPNTLNQLVGSLSLKSCIHPKNGICLISIVTNKTLYKAKKTGI